jgi:hypothetical protein
LPENSRFFAIFPSFSREGQVFSARKQLLPKSGFFVKTYKKTGKSILKKAD